MKKVEIIRIDDTDIKSIENAEKRKFKLENAGYTLVQTRVGLTWSELVYFKK